ncbi:MAG TPA: IMP dehydrogenase [Polyangiaceae bacterium]|nr:IMP dehydrogenase [Polyangiaceae bacterium]
MADGSSWGQDSIMEPPREPPRSLVFALVEATREASPGSPARKRASFDLRLLGLPFLAAGLIVVALVHAIWLRVLLPFVLVAVGVAILVRGRRPLAEEDRAPRIAAVLRRSGRRTLPDPRSIRLELGPTPRIALCSERAGEVASLSLSDSFGVVLLSNRRRDHLVLALTSSTGTLLVGARLDAETKSTLSDLLARATTHGGDDSALVAASPDGTPVCISGDDFRVLVTELERLDPRAMDRVVLSDQRGETIRLEDDDLLVRGVHFDLSRPLEWKPIMFQEQYGQAFTLFYQGTWIRQGAAELVLVSLLSPNLLEATLDRAALETDDGKLAALDLKALHDQRLMRQAAADPPPVEQRVAIDGLFVVPIRAALDQAPRASSRRERTSYA